MSLVQNRKKSSLTQMRIASIGALSIILTILGAIALIRIIATELERNIKEQVRFSIELPQSFTKETYDELSASIYSISGVKKLTYVSADSALLAISSDLGENPQSILGYNPLAPVVRLEMDADYMSLDSLKITERRLADMGLSAQLQYEEAQLQIINRNIGIAEWVLWGLVAFQALFAFIQINNTIRMMIYSERLQIRTLTLVGASAWFIRRPMVARSMLDGFIASLLSVVIISAVVYVVELGLGISIVPFLSMKAIAVAVGSIVVVALLTCALTALRATQRYINMDGGKIHLI